MQHNISNLLYCVTVIVCVIILTLSDLYRVFILSDEYQNCSSQNWNVIFLAFIYIVIYFAAIFYGICSADHSKTYRTCLIILSTIKLPLIYWIGYLYITTPYCGNKYFHILTISLVGVLLSLLIFTVYLLYCYLYNSTLVAMRQRLLSNEYIEVDVNDIENR